MGWPLSIEPSIVVALLAMVTAAAAGWALVARRRRSADASRAYLKGFRYILSDEPDAALVALTRAVEVDERTVETYLALGALFRRTGDHERAIRLHQNMLLRADLQPALERQIQFELGLDFHRAGMLERAAETYRLLTDSEPLRREALTRLRQVYEERLDFPRAAETQGELVRQGDGTRSVLAHLLAEAALAEKEPEIAADFARRARQVDPDSAHAALALGLVSAPRDREAAVSALQAACSLDPELAARAAEPMARAGGPERAVAFFSERLAAGEHPAIRVALARGLRQAGRIEEAAANLRRALELDPGSVETQVELGQALLESGMGDEARRELEALLSELGRRGPGFACVTCGHGYSQLQFRCGRCFGWDTIVRRTSGAEGWLRRR